MNSMEDSNEIPLVNTRGDESVAYRSFHARNEHGARNSVAIANGYWVAVFLRWLGAFDAFVFNLLCLSECRLVRGHVLEPFVGSFIFGATAESMGKVQFRLTDRNCDEKCMNGLLLTVHTQVIVPLQFTMGQWQCSDANS